MSRVRLRVFFTWTIITEKSYGDSYCSICKLAFFFQGPFSITVDILKTLMDHGYWQTRKRDACTYLHTILTSTGLIIKRVWLWYDKTGLSVIYDRLTLTHRTKVQSNSFRLSALIFKCLILRGCTLTSARCFSHKSVVQNEVFTRRYLSVMNKFFIGKNTTKLLHRRDIIRVLTFR